MTKLPDITHLQSSPRAKELEIPPQISAVYFLVRGEEVIYVGQTENVIGVAARHRDRSFDRMFYVPVPSKDLDRVEKACICYFWAPENTQGRNNQTRKDDARKLATRIAREALGLPPDDYPMSVAADIVLLGFPAKSPSLKVLLIRRKAEPFQGCLALPGGRVEPEESAESAALRELQEEASLQPSHLEQLYTFSEPRRDPRGRVVSVAYLGLVNIAGFKPKAGSDALDAQWYDVQEALAQPLAFDHQNIIQMALTRVQGKVRYTPIGFDLLPKMFTLGDLHHLYEVLLGRKLDLSNFRKKILDLGVLVKTSYTQRGPHRPAPLYRFNEEKYEELTKKGWNFEV